jgi:two-component system, OmpR family, sensor histidine kinase QseC
MRSAFFRLLHSLAVRLLCTYIAALLVTMACIAAAIWFSADQDAGVNARVQLQKLSEILQKRMRFDRAQPPGIEVLLPNEFSWVFDDFAADAKYAVLDRAGHIIVASGNHPQNLTPSGQAIAVTPQYLTVTADGQTLFVRTESMTHGTQTYYIQVAVSRRFAQLLRMLTGQVKVANSLRLALGSILLVILAVYFTLRRVLKPLRETSEAAAAIDAHNISKRLATRDLPVEFLPVVEAFNLTLERLEKGYRVQRAFLASAAHELKTPLAVMRAQIELNSTPDRDALLYDIDFMGRQVNQLLHLAEASEAHNYSFEPVDISVAAEDAADYLQALAERRAVYLDVRSISPSVVVQADRGAVFMLLKNLVENAIQHSPAGGGVTVTVDANRLCVRDEGPGISADELPKVFERFWRGSLRQNEGAGLGLSICAEIAAAHEWQLTASGGPGAQFVLSFQKTVAAI